MTRKRALICGASQGIGQATAFELAGLGLQITVFAAAGIDSKDLSKNCRETVMIF